MSHSFKFGIQENDRLHKKMKGKKRARETCEAPAETTSDTITLRKGDVPGYLQDSAFYKSLDWSEEDVEISVPRDCFKPNETVENVEDACLLLNCMQYWGLPVSKDLLKHCCRLPLHQRTFLMEKFPNLKPLTVVAAKRDLNMLEAVQQNDLYLVRELVEMGCQFTRTCVEEAASLGNLEMIQLMRDTPNTTYRSNVAGMDFVERIIDAYGHAYSRDKASLADFAALSANIQLIEYFNVMGALPSRNVLSYAVSSGNLECVKYVHKNMLPKVEVWYRSACVISAQSTALKLGRLDILQYLFEKSGTMGYNFLTNAVESNILDVVQFLVTRGGPDHVWPVNSIESCKSYEVFERVMGVNLSTECRGLKTTKRLAKFAEKYAKAKQAAGEVLPENKKSLLRALGAQL